MRKLFYPLVMASLVLTSGMYAVNADDYKIKDNHSIAFKSKDPSGSFTEINGTVKFEEADLAGSKFILKIPVSSLSTGNGMMNKKAQTSEWFNAPKYPSIEFVSTKIEKSGDAYSITGKLTIKGITKEKKIPAKLVKSGNDLTFSGSFGVNRIEYKVGKESESVPNVMNVSYTLPLTKK